MLTDGFYGQVRNTYSSEKDTNNMINCPNKEISGCTKIKYGWQQEIETSQIVNWLHRFKGQKYLDSVLEKAKNAVWTKCCGMYHTKQKLIDRNNFETLEHESRNEDRKRFDEDKLFRVEVEEEEEEVKNQAELMGAK